MGQLGVLFGCGLVAIIFGVLLWRDSSKRSKGWAAALERLVSILAMLFGAGNFLNICYQLSQVQ